MKILKLKAGALQLTTFISVVVALLLISFVLLINLHKYYRIDSRLLINSVHKSHEGIEYALNNYIPLVDSLLINEEANSGFDISLNRGYWGVFEKVISIAQIKHKIYNKIALIGGKQLGNRTALYLKENNKPLVLVGNTRIEGLSYIPKQGIRTGNIAGHAYYGEKLIYGSTQTSHDLPKIDKELRNQIQAVHEESDFNNAQILDLSNKKSHSNSFYNTLDVFYDTNKVNLINIKLNGHIKIVSKQKIVVHPSCKLTDVILIAPEIEIKRGFRGSIQAFATHSLIIEKDVNLEYPSALVLNIGKSKVSSNQQTKQPFIHITNGSEIKGLVMALGSNPMQKYKPSIIIEENAQVIGEVYCSSLLELSGMVNGSVFTGGFVANKNGTTYQNHIYNGHININKLQEAYVGLLFESSNKNIARWLY